MDWWSFLFMIVNVELICERDNVCFLFISGLLYIFGDVDNNGEMYNC